MRLHLWASIILLCFAMQVHSATWKAKVQVWIYPAAVTCVAKQEYQDGRGLFAIKPEYFTIDTNGKWRWLNETTGQADTCNGYSADNVATIKANSIEQWVTISAGFPSMVAFFASNAQKTSAITTWTEFCVQSGFTGVELDWEGYGDWTSADYTDYKTFITQLGNALHAKGKKLMLNGPPISDAKSQAWYFWKYEEFSNLPVDYMSVMAYDYMYDYGCGTPVQPLDWMKDVIRWTLDKYPFLDKIVVGIPSYGYSGATGSFNVGRTNKADASRIQGFSGATRDTSSAELSWVQGADSHFFVDSIGLDTKRKAIEDMGIKHVSVFHLGGNDWFSGVEPEGGYAGSPPAGNTGSSETSTNIPPSTDPAGNEICCGKCSEMGGNNSSYNKLPLIIAIVIVVVVGISATILGTFLGYRYGRKNAGTNAGLQSPEVVPVPINSGPLRSVSESFGESNSPQVAPFGLQKRNMFMPGIVDSPDLSQLRKNNAST